VRTPVPEAQVLSVRRGDVDTVHPRKLHLTLEAPKGAGWTLGDCFWTTADLSEAVRLRARSRWRYMPM
jgi:hypothetical protein